jgi:hypothetical protein
MAAYNKYLKICILFAIVLCFSLLFNYIFINHAYEILSYDKIVDIQQQINAIWGSALNSETFIYKIELFKKKKPEIIALGSSRSYQFREESFAKSFVNCGGTVVLMNYGRIFLEEIFKYHKPKLIILCLDFWYFNDRYPKPESDPKFVDGGPDLSIFRLRQPFVWLWKGKLTIEDYFNILIFRNNRNKTTNYDNMGVLAIKRSAGFRKDGSYLHADLMFGFRKNPPDFKFKTSINNVVSGIDKFMHGVKLSEYSIDELNKIINMCNDNNVKLIIILPPIAYTVYNRMQKISKEYEFIDKLREYVVTLPVETYDFHNIKDVMSGDCECIDGFHAGDVTYQKMLLAIIKKNPHTVLRKYLNIDSIQKSVRENAGKAMIKYDKAMYNFNEVDFLGIGCTK